jgi:hypothetical protein
MAMRGQRLLIVPTLAALALVGAGAGCGNEAPLFPTYHNDVQPIMQAHCIRCHGAGGTLNLDPDIPVINGSMTPKTTDFTTYDKLKAAAPTLQAFILSGPMPPPPSTKLDSYDYDTIVTWANNPLP